jgi:hypothetical protein
LVNRGFVPWYGNREKLVDITISEAKTSIQVKLIKPKKRIQFYIPMTITIMLKSKLCLSALLRFTDSDKPFVIFKLFL